MRASDMKKECQECGAAFTTRRKAAKFCSRKCANIHQGKHSKPWNLREDLMKTCDTCGEHLPINKFSRIDKLDKNSPVKDTCKRCSHAKREQERRDRTWKDDARQCMLNNCRQRAKEKSIPFNIDKEDIVIPDVCPVLGIKLERGGSFKGNSPSVDKFIPELGYVKGNVHVISYRANSIKTDATLEEILKIAEYMSNRAI